MNPGSANSPKEHSMNQKKLTLLIILLILSQGLFAESKVDIHSVSLFGFEPVSRYENVVTGTGISLAQEVYISWGELIHLGAGFRYLFPRETENEEQLSWIPVYAAAKLFLPVESIPLYAKGTIGYSFVNGNSAAVLNKPELKGGFYFNIGGGVDLPLYYTENLRFSFIFDMGWSSFSGSYTSGEYEQSLTFMTMDLLAGLGIRF